METSSFEKRKRDDKISQDGLKCLGVMSTQINNCVESSKIENFCTCRTLSQSVDLETKDLVFERSVLHHTNEKKLTKDMQWKKARILSKSTEKCPNCHLGKPNSETICREEVDKLWCVIVYPHDYYNKFSRKRISKSNKNNRTFRCTNVEDVRLQSPPCLDSKMPEVASRPESVNIEPCNTPVTIKPQYRILSPTPISISPVQDLMLSKEASSGARYSPDSEYSFGRAEHLIEKYIPKRVSIHKSCYAQNRLGSNEKSDNVINRKKSMRGFEVKRDFQKEDGVARTQSVYAVGSLGLTYSIPEHNQKLRRRQLHKTVQQGYNPRTNFLQFSYSRQNGMPPIKVGIHADRLHYTNHNIIKL